MSDQPSIVAALAAVMEDVRGVRKGDRNQQQGYAFRGIDSVMNAVGPALRKHSVVCLPMLEEVNYRDVQTSTGKASRECTVKVRYRFHGPAGDYLDCVTPGESMDFGDKGAPKAMSVAYRIALLQALCLPTDDTDPDAENYERAARNMPAPRTETPAPAKAPSDGPAPMEQQTRTLVETLLTVDTPGRADKGLSVVQESPVKDAKVAHLLGQQDRDALAVTDMPDLTLVQLAHRVGVHVRKHKRSVRPVAVDS